MKLDCIASERHYADHLLPVWDALLDDIDGGEALTHPYRLSHRLAWGDTPVLVASWKDARTATRKGRPVVLMEHGAGQSYAGVDNPGYVGASDRSGVILYLAPNESAAERHRAAHPEIPVEVVGCPKLDRLLAYQRPRGHTVALTHHWMTGIAPETKPAFPHFAGAYPALAKRFDLLVHAHPRDTTRQAWCQRNRLAYAASFEQVVTEATVLVVDNSSVGAEWLALDRPVVWLNAPWYRRDVHHGGRFWEWARAGIEVDDPADLETAVAASLATDPMADARRKMIPSLYANLGCATQAAAAAIRSHLNA